MSLMMLLAAASAGCGDRPNQTAMTICQRAAAERADAQMNRAWAQVYQAMRRADRSDPPAARRSATGYAAALLASQRAWLTFRDAQCRIESYEGRGGTMQPFAENQCLADVTVARTRQLHAMLAWTGR